MMSVPVLRASVWAILLLMGRRKVSLAYCSRLKPGCAPPPRMIASTDLNGASPRRRRFLLGRSPAIFLAISSSGLQQPTLRALSRMNHHPPELSCLRDLTYGLA